MKVRDRKVVESKQQPFIVIHGNISDAMGFSHCIFFYFFIAGFTFADCRSLTVAPIIPATVTDIDWTFSQCFNLTGTITINANPSSYSKCFQNIDMTNITLTGSASKDVLNLIGSTGRNWTPIS